MYMSTLYEKFWPLHYIDKRILGTNNYCWKNQQKWNYLESFYAI